MSVSPFPFPILETKRLVLREWEESDAEALFRSFSSPEVVMYTPLHAHTDVAMSLSTVRRFRARFHEKREGIAWAIARKGHPCVRRAGLRADQHYSYR